MHTSAAPRKPGAQWDVERTSSLRRVGRPAATCGVVATLPLVPAVVDAVAPIPRFLLADEMPIHEVYRRRLIAASEADAEWYANLYEVGWPDAPQRAIHNSTAERWEAAGRPAPGSRPGEGEVIAHFSSGEAIVRYEPAPPMVGTTGEIEALSLWAGQSVALAKQSQPAAEIVAELVSRL